jgi:hypothetical protein
LEKANYNELRLKIISSLIGLTYFFETGILTTDFEELNTVMTIWFIRDQLPEIYKLKYVYLSAI